jgi:EmrB/QacA subfamily drug resistance transporter
MTQPSAVAPQSGTTIPWAVFAITVTGAFMVALDLSIVNVAFPSIEESFPGVSTAALSWVLTSYSVVFGALLLGSGRVADRSGRKRWFLHGLLVFTIGSAICAIAPEVWVLITGRAVQATGAALLMPASLGLLLAATPAVSRAPAVALWGGISALAVATGPSLGAVLIDAGGWRWAFIVNLPVALVAGIAARRHLAESAVGGPFPDVVGVAAISVGVAALALAITQGEAWGWGSAGVLGSFAVAAVLLPYALRRSTRHRAPAIDIRVFQSRTVALANAATFVFSVGFFAMLLANVLFLTSVWGYSTLRAGLAITPGPLVVAALSGYTGRLARRFGYRPVLVAGGVVFAAGVGWYAIVVDAKAQYLTHWLPAAVLVGLGVAMVFPVVSAAAVADLPMDRFAAGGAINQTARQVGAVLGIAILVAIVGAPSSIDDALSNFRSAWLMCAGASLAAALLSAFQASARPSVAATATTPALVEMERATL